MKTLLLATVSAVVLSGPAGAVDRYEFRAPLLRVGPPAGDSNGRYFNPIERVLSPLINEDFRYPRPEAFADGMDVPDGAGAPVPVDPVSLVGAVPPGANSVPIGFSSRGGASLDAKGDARLDRRGAPHRSADRGRQAW